MSSFALPLASLLLAAPSRREASFETEKRKRIPGITIRNAGSLGPEESAAAARNCVDIEEISTNPHAALRPCRQPPPPPRIKIRFPRARVTPREEREREWRKRVLRAARVIWSVSSDQVPEERNRTPRRTKRIPVLVKRSQMEPKEV